MDPQTLLLQSTGLDPGILQLLHSHNFRTCREVLLLSSLDLMELLNIPHSKAEWLLQHVAMHLAPSYTTVCQCTAGVPQTCASSVGVPLMCAGRTDMLLTCSCASSADVSLKSASRVDLLQACANSTAGVPRTCASSAGDCMLWIRHVSHYFCNAVLICLLSCPSLVYIHAGSTF